jgi:hypothetical protein
LSFWLVSSMNSLAAVWAAFWSLSKAPPPKKPKAYLLLF